MPEHLQTRTERQKDGLTRVSKWEPTGNEEQPWRPVSGAVLDRHDRVVRNLKPEELGL